MSSIPHNTSSKKRVLSILRTLIENPGYYTKRKLAEIHATSLDTITRDFEEIRNAGFELLTDSNHRYFFTAEKATDLLKELLVLSDSEKNTIKVALKATSSEKDTARILRKLESITNLPRIGNIIFTKPYLAKTNNLFKALKDKQKVILYNYKSTNSNTHADRCIEPFHVSPEEDILHAYDLERQEIRHFRISRIDRVEQLDEDWENEGKHNIIATDIFRISNKEQVKVHIRIKTGGYNELVERYPLSKGALSPSPDTADEYDLECMVNNNFYGLSNFLLGYDHYVVEIIENDLLRKHMADKVKQLAF